MVNRKCPLTTGYPHYYTALYTNVLHIPSPDYVCLLMDENSTVLWQSVLKEIEKEVSRANFLTLFRNTGLESIDDNIATIAAPSLMIIDLLQKRFMPLIQRHLDEKTGSHNDILFISKATNRSFEKQPDEDGPLFQEQGKPATAVAGHLPRVRSEYTFANFAVSSSNQLAWASATTVSQNIGTSYNPFFIYGPVGVGKTHLMHAVANAVYQQAPDKKIIYITSEEFTNEVVEAIRGNDTARMKRKFRSAYLLLIDDIQFIEGKKAVQEEIFHTFNALIDQGSQIALSSDRPPHEIKNIMDRLSSRFAGGLTVDIQTPDLELKTAILKIKAQKFGYELPTDVAMFLATNAQETRSLEGLLLRVITQATATGVPISIALAEKSLGGVIEERRHSIHSEDIIQAVCSFYNVKPTVLKGIKRDAGIVRARQAAMYLLKKEMGLTYVEIGNMLGGRDHTTIMHGVDKIADILDKKALGYDDIMGISRTLRG